jgi:hypothetical protein
MNINFKTREINRDIYKLVWIFMLIIEANFLCDSINHTALSSYDIFFDKYAT